MEHLPLTNSILEKFDVSPDRGFIPASDPITSLPLRYNAWDELANSFTDFINAGVIRKRLDEMPLIDNPDFQSKSEWERAALLLTSFAMAYVNYGTNTADHLPSSISVPLLKVANHLKRVPILTHASLALNNWRKLDPTKPIALDNLTTIIQFHGGLDESWFYLVTTMIEKAGAPAIPTLLDSHILYKEGQVEQATSLLQYALIPLNEMNRTLSRMYECCEPNIFYQRIRPFLDSFHEVEYQGTDAGKLSFHGGSAAQSSLIQYFDAILGLSYEKAPQTNNYLRKMRKYMPYEHAAFLEFIEQKYSYKGRPKSYPELQTSWDAVVDQLIMFRNEHLKMVSIYIIKQAKAQNSEAVGTGGTNPLKFLKSIRNSNQIK